MTPRRDEPITEPFRPADTDLGTRLDRLPAPAVAAGRLADAVRAWRLGRFVTGTPGPTDEEAAMLRALAAYDAASGGGR